MNTLKYLLFIFGSLLYTCTAVPCKKVCILDNVTCVTRGGFNVYKAVVNGVRGLIKPLDPLYIEEIHGEMASVEFKLTNITMIGLKGCTVTKLTLNATENIYKQYLHCPKLISRFHFDTQGDSNSTSLRGTGDAIVVAYDYDILNYGKYSVFVNKDHRPHFFIRSHESKTHLKGNLAFEFTKAYIVDSSRAYETEGYLNEHWRETEDLLHKPIVKRAMSILLAKIDVYIRAYTMGEVLPENKYF